MSNKTIISLLFVLAGTGATSAQAANSIGYWYDSSGDIVRTGAGECWRTIRWSSDNAIAGCEGGSANSSSTAAKTESKPQAVASSSRADSDKDGVIDSRDECPNTSKGTRVNASGCALDLDNDGVANTSDNCPDTAPGIKVDNTGCAMDSDADGIVDSSDKCPDTSSGTVVDRRGCELQADISLDNVQFNTGTAILSSSSRNILDKVARTLVNNPHLDFEIAGHTDNTGNYQNNVKLSEKRASSVRQYLIDGGVAASRLSARGYGPDKPVASNDTREGRKQNRRVELVLQ